MKSMKFKLRKVFPVTNLEGEPLCLNTIYLTPTKPITFGRNPGPDIKYTLMSKTTPLMISRKHATIACNENGVWTVIDHKSLNGVYVNQKRIEQNIKEVIKVGDNIAFGCGVRDQKPEFEYSFEASARGPRMTSQNGSIDSISSVSSQESPPKRQKIDNSQDKKSILNSSVVLQTNKLLIKEQEERIKRLSEELNEKERAQGELQHRLEETEQGLVEKLEQQQIDLQTERTEAEAKLQTLLENQLKEKELILRSEYDEQMNVLIAERELIETSLQKELANKLSEKDLTLQTELEKQRAKLDQQMTEKEQEREKLVAELQAKEGLLEQYKSVEENQKQLEGCLVQLRQQIQEKDELLNQQKEDSKNKEEEARQTVVSAMEDEFTCIICQELFINATILPCAHTFCDLCIRGWMKKKKNCPVCRRSMNVSKAVRSYAFESAIEKIVESLDEDYKKRRAATKIEREAELKRENSQGDIFKDFIQDPNYSVVEEDSPRGEQSRAGPSRVHQQNRRHRSRSRSPGRYNNHRHNRHNNYENEGQQGYYNNRNQQQPQVSNMNNFFQHPPVNSGGYSGPQQQRQREYDHYGHPQQQPYGYPHYNQVQPRGCFLCGDLSHIARNCHRGGGAASTRR